MKTKITALALVAVTAIALTPKSAHAGDKEIAAIGGFIGGLIVGNAISKHSNDHHHSTTVIVDHGPGHHHHHAPNGYWRETQVKVWVPARWVYERDRHGCEIKRYVAGHYDWRTERVWVSTAPRGHGHGHVVIGRR